MTGHIDDPVHYNNAFTQSGHGADEAVRMIRSPARLNWTRYACSTSAFLLIGLSGPCSRRLRTNPFLTHAVEIDRNRACIGGSNHRSLPERSMGDPIARQQRSRNHSSTAPPVLPSGPLLAKESKLLVSGQ